MFELKSSGGAKEKQNSGLGVFTLQSDQINGRPHYINNNGRHMYWDEDGDLLVINLRLKSHVNDVSLAMVFTEIHCKELIPIMQYTLHSGNTVRLDDI